MRWHASIDAGGPQAGRPYHHGNLRRALLDEALATIRAEGVDGLTLREIGARLGVSRTALYRHFADKRALLAAVATEGFRTLRAAARRGVGGGRPRPRGVRLDGGGLRSLRRRQPVALSRDVRRVRRPSRGVRARAGRRGRGRLSGARRCARRAAARRGGARRRHRDDGQVRLGASCTAWPCSASMASCASRVASRS